MKKLLLLALAVPAIAFAQSYPSPTFNSVILQNPLTPANGGTGATSSTGTGSVVLSNSPSLASPTITGSLTATGLVTLPSLAAQAANTVIANATGSSASPTAFSMPSCSNGNQALRWTSGSGFTCTSTMGSTTSGLNQFAATTSAQLASVISDETGSGALVFANAPTFTGQVTLAYSTPSLLINDTSGSNASQITLQQSGSTQWSLSSSIGHNFNIGRNLSGAFVDNPLSIAQSTGLVTMPDGAAITGGSINNAPIGATTASTGAFTALSASTSATVPTVAVGTNSTAAASTAFVAKHAPCPSILDNGGDNTGTNDNSTAFATTAALGPSGQACVYFPPGTYAFSSQLSYSLPTSTASITIIGAGADVSILKWAAGGGLKVNYLGASNSAHLRDFSVVTGTTATGNGIWLNQQATTISNPANSAISDITGVSIRGSDGYAQTNYWDTGLNISGVSNVNILGSSITGQGAGYTTVGTGVNIIGTANAQGVQYQFVGNIIQYVGTGLVYSNYVQGVTIAQTNFTGDNFGVFVNTPAQGQDQLTITGSQFNCANIGIYDKVGIAGLSIYGNYIIVPYTTGSTATGIQLASVFGAAITSNVIQRIGSSNTNTNGIIVQGAGSISGVITGNVLANLFTGIWLTSASSNINVQSNAYTGNTNSNVLNQGTGNTVGGGSP
ncbi:beta strand repeat-containing protein [Burkholderia pseudomultivorans]|uniref:beta strand repeat-containing protein n=1 Tax=Burkholderia pseudomultivorans TaxID=1207504 RepID=UPI000A84EFD6|nr:hypothetical protein [Burkholderia pseudomultivorans]